MLPLFWPNCNLFDNKNTIATLYFHGVAVVFHSLKPYLNGLKHCLNGLNGLKRCSLGLAHCFETSKLTLNHVLVVGSIIVQSGSKQGQTSPQHGTKFTVWIYRWIISQLLLRMPYSRWRSRLVDRLLIAIESRGGQDNV